MIPFKITFTFKIIYFSKEITFGLLLKINPFYLKKCRFTLKVSPSPPQIIILSTLPDHQHKNNAITKNTSLLFLHLAVFWEMSPTKIHSYRNVLTAIEMNSLNLLLLILSRSNLGYALVWSTMVLTS